MWQLYEELGPRVALALYAENEPDRLPTGLSLSRRMAYIRANAVLANVKFGMHS